MDAKLLALLFALFLVPGCTLLGITEQKTLKQQQVGDSWINTDQPNRLDVLSFPSQLRGAYAYRGLVNVGTESEEKWEKRYAVCAEPFADIGMSSSLDTTLDLINDISNSTNSSSEFSRGQDQTGKVSRVVEKSTVNEDGTVTTTVVTDYHTSATQSTTSSGNRSLGLSQSSNQRATAGLNATSTVVSLGGRSQYVVLARELLYRTCESAANGFLNAGAVKEQHDEVIKALTKMLAAEEKTAEAKKTNADAALEGQKARYLEALYISDVDAADISGDPYRVTRRLLSKELIECSTKFNSISDPEQRQQRIDSCAENVSKQIQRLGR